MLRRLDAVQYLAFAYRVLPLPHRRRRVRVYAAAGDPHSLLLHELPGQSSLARLASPCFSYRPRIEQQPVVNSSQISDIYGCPLSTTHVLLHCIGCSFLQLTGTLCPFPLLGIEVHSLTQHVETDPEVIVEPWVPSVIWLKVTNLGTKAEGDGESSDGSLVCSR
jgi:hypothetical protein